MAIGLAFFLNLDMPAPVDVSLKELSSLKNLTSLTVTTPIEVESLDHLSKIQVG